MQQPRYDEHRIRPVSRLLTGMPASDGAGVRLTRLIASPELDMLDPFLLLDAFDSMEPADYLAGFPPHPHRGFETVTYMLAGRMRHKDNAGHEGVIETGGVQWMTAGRGIIHSEMPEQREGRMSGLQLWVNLPAQQKMTAPDYREYSAQQIPTESRAQGVRIKVIAGTTSQGTAGAITDRAVDPLYLDIVAAGGATFVEPVASGYNAFVYMIEGSAAVAAESLRETTVAQGQLAVLGDGEQVEMTAGVSGARFVLIAGKPLKEPVARRGPFVMNTTAELRQAFDDYARGAF